MDTVLFDTETTGLLQPRAAGLKHQPYIIEFYGIRVDENFKPQGEVNTFINIPFPIPEHITAITKITPANIRNAPYFDQVAQDICDLFDGADEAVAHNLAFDRDMVSNELARNGFEMAWPDKMTCTVRATMRIEQRRMNLQKLHEWLFGHGFKGAHRAKTDVMALGRCYVRLKEMGWV